MNPIPDAIIKRLKAEVERLRKLEGTDDHPEHRCERCGGRNTIWYADSDVWNRISGDWSILCPICFCELGAEAGTAPTAWRLSIEGDDPEVSKLQTALHGRLKEAAELHERLTELLDAADDMRAYTHDWDWKYGEYWDGELAKAREATKVAE
jgi:hypothetical protein